MSETVRPPLWLVIVKIAGVLAVMVLVSIPVVRRSSRLDEERRIRRTLMQIVMAKQDLIPKMGLEPGTALTMKELIDGSIHLEEAPFTPKGGKYIVGSVGELPRFERERDGLDIRLKRPEPAGDAS